MSRRPGMTLLTSLLPSFLMSCLLMSWHGLVQRSLGGPVATFNDIEFWVGQGTNRSAMVIDWDGNTSTDLALVWGYRWDGSATGASMFEAIIAEDDRLFAKVNMPKGSISAIYGLGFDSSDDDNSGDGEFQLDDGTQFDIDGLAVTSPTDGAESIDPDDLYAEGWFAGLWHYGINDPNQGDGNPFGSGSWLDSPDGMASRLLVDGSWDSWAFTQPISLTQFATNPVAATVPDLIADFDTDGDVDGADFLIWQKNSGTTAGATLAQGDANDDALVDELDLELWQIDFGSIASVTAAVALVPEPSTICLLIFIPLIRSNIFRRKE